MILIDLIVIIVMGFLIANAQQKGNLDLPRLKLKKLMTTKQFVIALSLNLIVLGAFGMHIMSETTKTVVQHTVETKIKLQPTIVVKHEVKTNTVVKTQTKTVQVCNNTTEYMALMQKAADICNTGQSYNKLGTFHVDSSGKPIFVCN